MSCLDYVHYIAIENNTGIEIYVPTPVWIISALVQSVFREKLLHLDFCNKKGYENYGKKRHYY